MTAQFASTADGMFRAWCSAPCVRPLDLTVSTFDHARNLAAKHNRDCHPDAPAAPVPGEDPAPVTDLDLTAAARYVVDMWERVTVNTPDPYRLGRWDAAEGIWRALTGAEDTDDALTLARTYAARATTAHVPPL